METMMKFLKFWTSGKTLKHPNRAPVPALRLPPTPNNTSAAPVAPRPSPATQRQVPPTRPVVNASRFSEVMYEHSEDLPLFERKLYDEVHMLQSLRHRLCPVLLPSVGGKKQFAIVSLAGEAKTDIAEDLITKLGLMNYEQAPVLFWIASTTVLVELARDVISEKKAVTRAAAMAHQGQSALYSMFESAAQFAVNNDASDLHFEINNETPTSWIKFRIDGRLTSPRQFELSTPEVADMIAYMYNICGKSGSENTYNANKPQQCYIKRQIANRALMFRWASHQDSVGTKVVMRMLYQDTSQSIRTLVELGYLPSQVAIWQRAIARLGGATLISGVVGSGKSTTIQTVMSMLPDWMAKYTVEDPVEYGIPGTIQFSCSRQLSASGDDPFIAAKRQLKRMDPDAVLVGEIRDHESAGLFRDIAESGHRAFATVHAPSAIDMITLRLVSDELGIPRDVIATPNFINLLVYQALVPKLCPHCNLPAQQVYSAEYIAKVERLFKLDMSKVRARNSKGCKECNREALPELNGSRGRLVVAEMIEPDSRMLLLFRESKNLELKQYIQNTRTAAFDEEDSTGKNALEVAMYHVSRGIVDPLEVEAKFGSFDAYEREMYRPAKASRRNRVPAPGRASRISNGFRLR